MEGAPRLADKLKSYHIEIVCGLFFAIAVGYFCYGLYGNKQNQEFLEQAKSKLLLMEARQTRVIEQKLNEEEEKSCRECFEAALADAGFKILKIEHKLNHISAVVVNNSIARARLLNILEGVQYVESRESLEVRWFFNSKTQRVHVGVNDNAIATDEEDVSSAGNANAYSAASAQRENSYEKGGLTLSAICFFDDASWQVWINGKMYEPGTKKLPNGSVIEKVTANKVFVRNGKKTITLQLD